MERMRTKIAAVLVAGLVLAAGACGGGSKDESSTKDDAITADADDTTTTKARDKDKDSDNDIDFEDAFDGLSGDCMQAGMAYFALSMQALGAAFGMSDSDIEEMQDQINELKADIPSKIEDDFEVFADALAEYAEAMKGMNLGDLMNGSSDAEDAAKILETPEVEKATQNIEAYFDEECPS
jgi:hypothetical protein